MESIKNNLTKNKIITNIFCIGEVQRKNSYAGIENDEWDRATVNSEYLQIQDNMSDQNEYVRENLQNDDMIPASEKIKFVIKKKNI